MDLGRLRQLALIVALLWIGPGGPVKGVEPGPADQLQVRFWGPADGLPEETVYSLAESEDGYLWIAVRDSLIRFDGKSFRVFYPAEALGIYDNGLGGVASSGGRLWVGARDYVAYSDLDAFHSFTNPQFRFARILRRPGERFGVAAMQVRPNGDLLLRRAFGVYLVKTQSEKNGKPAVHQLFSAPPGESISGMYEGQNGRIWYSTESGIKYWENGRETKVTGSTIQALPIIEASDGAIWIYEVGALCRFQGGKRICYPIHGNMNLEPQRGLIETRGGVIWAGEFGGVLCVQNGKVTRIRLTDWIDKDEVIRSLLQTRDGAIWAGTGRGRLLRLEKRVFHVVDLASGLGRTPVSVAAQDANGTVWVGTRSGGAYVQGKEGWRQVPGTTGALLHSGTALPDGRMALATSEGLMLGDRRGMRMWKPVPDAQAGRTGALSVVEGDHFYYSDADTLYRVNVAAGGEMASTAVEKISMVRGILEEPDGIWAVTWNGVLERLAQSGRRSYLIDGGRERRGFCLYALSEDLFLIGTSTGVLAFDRRAERLAPAYPAFADEHIFYILEDRDQNLWFAGRRSLQSAPKSAVAEYFRGRRTAIAPLKLTTLQGLPSANFGLGTSSLGMVDQAGRVWLASLGGAVRFDPSQVRPAAQPVRCAIEEILADGRPVPLGEETGAQIPAGTRRLHLRYTALGRKSAENPWYRFRLRGDQGSWQETGATEATFTNLAPGAYSFQLQARVVTQDWNGPVAELPFEVLPLWYERKAVQGLGALLLVMLAVGVFVIRERHARRIQEQLEKRVQMRTSDLLQAREAAEAARQQAEKAARAKADFLATMSHEIRTPLNGIVGLTELLEHTGLSGPQEDYTTMLKSSANALRSLVNDVLDFSKIDAAALVLERLPFSPAELVWQVAGLFRPEAERKGLRLEVTLAADLPGWVEGDAGRVQQILGNLLSNAVKFTTQGEIRLSITRGAGNILRFHVRDTGIGIPEAKRDLIFDVFTQAESSTTRRFGGTGLGLAICRRLTAAMGGVISVESEVGSGSEFTVELPLPVCGPPAAAEQSPEGSRFDGLKALLVEDNAVNQLVAARLLQKLGCSVETAVDGQEGVEMAGRGGYDIIFMDCHMPRLDGYSATRVIRALPAPVGATPIIALTAGALVEVRQECLASGMNDYLAKPIQLEDLRNILSRYAPRPQSLGQQSSPGRLAPGNERLVPGRGAILVQSTPDT